jgi:glycosyltransferase involved in cell wall biosynthesis
MDLMKIAQIAPLYEAVPPRLYGGTERIVAHLTNALVELGHEVTLFASAEADTRATMVPVRDQAIRLDRFPLKSDLAAHLSMLHELHLRRHEFDLAAEIELMPRRRRHGSRRHLPLLFNKAPLNKNWVRRHTHCSIRIQRATIRPPRTAVSRGYQFLVIFSPQVAH